MARTPRTQPAVPPRAGRRALSDAEVAALLDAGTSERSRRIDTHVRFVDGTIYDGRPDFADDSCGLPLEKRRPCVIDFSTKNAIKSFGDMVFGESGFPDLTSAPTEDDQTFEGEDGLSEKDSALLDHAARKVVEQARLRAVGKQILACAMAAGSVAVLASVRGGRLRVSTIPAKCVDLDETEFDDDDPCKVRKLVVSYRYETKERDPADGRMKPHVYQYRREIDEKADVTFEPVEVFRPTEFPTPSAPKETVKHGFGFCPVVFYGFDREESEDAGPDGHPVHEGMLSLIDGVSQAKSQRHRAGLYCGDPQVVETGVADEDVRVPMGSADAAADRRNDATGWSRLSGRASGEAKRKKGAGTVWRYESESAKVAYLSLAGDALKVLVDDGKDLVADLKAGLRVIDIDPETLTGSGDISGKTLAFIFARQVAAANTIREDFWTNCALPVLGMLFRIVLKTKKGLYLPAAEKARTILDRYEREVAGATGGKVAWFDPPLRPVWPDYFSLTSVDEQAVVTLVVAAGDKISPVTALTKLKTVFPDIKDPVAYAEEREEARLEAQKQQQALAVEQMKALHGAKGGDDAEGDDGGAPPGGGSKPPAPGTRSGGGAAAPGKNGPARPKGGAKPPAKDR